MENPTSRSYTYIVAGHVNDVHLMKVGKTNHLQRRSRQLGLSITVSTALLTEAAAFRVESDLRKFVIQQGGIRFKKTLDWFIFDERIYDLLQEYFSGLSESEPESALSLDEEIALYRRRYIELIEAEYRREIEARRAQIQVANAEIDRLRTEIERQRERYLQEIKEMYAEKSQQNSGLYQRIGMLEERERTLSKQLEEQRGK